MKNKVEVRMNNVGDSCYLLPIGWAVHISDYFVCGWPYPEASTLRSEWTSVPGCTFRSRLGPLTAPYSFGAAVQE